MTHQDIADEVARLDSELEGARQACERAQVGARAHLRAACEALGHVYVPVGRDYSRACAACGAVEPRPKNPSGYRVVLENPDGVGY